MRSGITSLRSDRPKTGKALNTQHLDHTPLQLSKVQVRASGPWRALEVLGGIIVIAVAIFALADPQFTTQTLVIVIAAGLIIGGLFRITVGAFATVLPSPLRSLNVTGGVIAFVLGIAALLDLQAAVATLIGILAVALLLVGAVEIGVGVARHPPVRQGRRGTICRPKVIDQSQVQSDHIHIFVAKNKRRSFYVLIDQVREIILRNICAPRY